MIECVIKRILSGITCSKTVNRKPRFLIKKRKPLQMKQQAGMCTPCIARSQINP